MSVLITEELFRSGKAAGFAEKKDEETGSLRGNKWKLLQEELAVVKRKKRELENLYSSSEKDVEKYWFETRNMDDFDEKWALIAKENSFRSTIKVKKANAGFAESSLKLKIKSSQYELSRHLAI